MSTTSDPSLVNYFPETDERFVFVVSSSRFVCYTQSFLSFRLFSSSSFLDSSRLNLGITAPISLNPATPADIESSTELKKSLIAQNLYESPAEAQAREAALGKLNLIVRDWSKNVSIKKVCYSFFLCVDFLSSLSVLSLLHCSWRVLFFFFLVFLLILMHDVGYS